MLKLKRFIEGFGDSLQAKRYLPPVEGSYTEFPEGLSSEIKSVLKERQINALYSHQVESFNSISSGKDTVIVSQTASGKTFSFFLPILDNYQKASDPFSVLLLYPTKALSRDQEGTLGALLEEVTGKRKMGTFDGDTPPEVRAQLQKSADFIVTNPDMLHSGVLPNHNRKWKSFLSRLKYIVVDEVHMYRGAYGSHVSNVFRRLLRVCKVHGSEPLFICSSATIGNAGEHVEKLFRRPFQVVKKDGSPRPARHLYFVNPVQAVSHSGSLYRKGTGSISVHLIREAAKRGVRTICFCRARQEVERLTRSVCDGHPQLRKVVKPYRGGLLPNERRSLEQGLFNGEIKVVITTNALELGMDIGDLELCILSGHPGSVASFWQQAGRVGRKKKEAVIVYIAKDTPVDQYIVNHTNFISSAPVEQAWLNADNPYILLQHLPCAAYEYPIHKEEKEYDTLILQEALEVLEKEKSLVLHRDYYRYALPDYPAKGVNLRGMTDYNIEIICDGVVIGELDPIGARGTLYKDAIYQHLGIKYMSLDLDLEMKLCKVEPVRVDYYTEAVWEKRLSVLEVNEKKEVEGHLLQFGAIEVNKQPKLYKKIRERTYENVGYGPITLAAFEYDTTGFCLLPSLDWKTHLDKVNKKYATSAFYGLSYILKKVAPSLCMGDSGDIETDVSLAIIDGEEWKSALYLYDTIEGGVGYGEKIYESFRDVLLLCYEIITECPCGTGCPSCVPTLPPGVENKELTDFLVESNGTVACTHSLLESLLHHKFYLPKITSFKSEIVKESGAGVDSDLLKLKSRLKRANGMLKKKKNKIH